MKKLITEISRRGFSERLYFFNWIVNWIFVLMCYILTIFSGKLEITDLSIVSVGVPASFAELGIHTGFIVWKAKAENCRKHKDVNLLSEIEEG